MRPFQVVPALALACVLASAALPTGASTAGERVLLFERTVSTTIGTYANVDAPLLPPARDGVIEICIEDDCSAGSYWVGTHVVANVWEGVPVGSEGAAGPRTCAHPSTFGRACTFDIDNRDGWNLDLAWEQTGQLTVTVRVTGIPR